MKTLKLPAYSDLCARGKKRPVAAVFGVEHFNGLAVVRSLGRRGVPVMAFGQEADSVGFRSRFSTESIVYPDPVKNEEGFIACLVEAGRRFTAAGLHPIAFATNDHLVRVMSTRRAELVEFYELFMPSEEVMEKGLDKLAQYRIAAEIGVDFPRTYTNGEEQKLLDDLDSRRVLLPLFLKPRAPLEDPSLNRRFRRVKLDTREQVESILRDAKEAGVAFVVQEFIPGGDEQFYAFGSTMDQKGRIVAACLTHKLRQMPPEIGICRVGESLYTPEIIEPSVKLLKALNYYGISETEYKLDPRDGKYKLMEVNPRSWSWIGLPIALGTDLPYTAFCAALGCELPEDAATNERSSLWISLSDDLENSLTYRDAFPWVDLFSRREKIVEAYFSADDLKPGLIHFRRTAAELGGRVFWKLAKLVGLRRKKPVTQMAT